MNITVRTIKPFILAGLMAFSVGSCGLIGGGGKPTSSNPGDYSSATGLAFNNGDTTFQVQDFDSQPDGPNLVYIEGGRMVLGSFEEDILMARDNLERTVTVASFYMDETEVANIHWLEYMFYVKDNYDTQDSATLAMYPTKEDYIASIEPNQKVWRSELAFNDPYEEQYLRYPGFRYFPVVGVSWVQATSYAKWRTNKINESLSRQAMENGYEPDSTWLASQQAETEIRLPIETGIVLPDYRLPSEAEWEYAAQALIGAQWLDELQTHQRLYPWDGHSLRNPYGKEMGYFLANFKRGRGDYAGIAGKLNDGAMITAYIYEYPPNDYGLYNMAGNVNEWVMDIYRPFSFQDMDDLNPMRRDGFLDEIEGQYNPETQLITDKTRVYKGGSWKDVAYWLSPGTRRYLDQDSATATIGFRCAMIRAGANY